MWHGFLWWCVSILRVIDAGYISWNKIVLLESRLQSLGQRFSSRFWSLWENFIWIDIFFIKYNIFADNLNMIFMDFWQQKIVDIVPIEIRLLISDKENSVFRRFRLVITFFKSVGIRKDKFIQWIEL